MREASFGRTNRQFPPVWLALHVPSAPSGNGAPSALMEYALASGVPIDIAAAPALFGSAVPPGSGATLIQNSSTDIERAVDSRHAGDLLQAHLVETLSAIGRPYIDFYFLRSRVAFEEAQISGVLEALESARQEGHVRFFGLRIENVAASIGNWQFHDAFDVISVPDELEEDERDMLRRMSLSRRTGYLTRTDRVAKARESGETILLNIKTVDQIASLGGQ
jgi:hypothetical protein